MSRLAKEYNRALRKQNSMYAAWFPVTNTLKLGDFGLVEGGVFRSMGNIRDTFNVDFKTEEGPSTKVDLASEGVTVVRFAGGAEVPAFPSSGDVEAKLNVNFSKENSFLVKANLTCRKMSNIQEVAWALDETARWKKKYKVIESVYVGKESVVILSSQSNVTVGLSGNAEALKLLEAGSASADVQIERDTKASFQSVGEEGVIGIRLFKMGWFGVDMLESAQIEAVEITDEDLEDDI